MDRPPVDGGDPGNHRGGEADDRPLADVTVLDLSAALAGPYAARLLAGLGARVIKVEAPDGASDAARRNAPYFGRDGVSIERAHDDDLSIAVLDRARGKLGVTLDLKHADARPVVEDLLRAADVLVENWSPGTADRLGVGPATTLAVNPRLVHCSITGYGSDAPGGRKAMDTTIQALSGFMMTSGAEGEPPVRSGVPIADLVAPLFAVIGAQAALHDARRTGRGRHVDVSMLAALTSLVAAEPYGVLGDIGIGARTGNHVPRLAPFGVFAVSDGHVALCGPTDRFTRGLFEAMGRPELAEDPRFRTRERRVANADELHGLVQAWFARHDRDTAITTLERHGVPVAPVREPADAVADPLVVHAGGTTTVRHPDHGGIDGLAVPGVPIRFDGAVLDGDAPAPHVGRDNDHVYGDLLRYPPERIASLRADGVI
ncbi:MAG: CoA transferase [Actinomycetota bacterium]|nr:CoA transferase [Actinomycetota bacterium]